MYKVEIRKVVCIKDLYYNLTKPYFLFECGKIYNMIIYYEGCYYFGFEFCPCTLNEKEVVKNFKPLEEFREEKLKNILE